MLARLVSLTILFALVLAQQCPQSTDPCASPACPPQKCGGFQVLQIQTNAQTGTTLIVINATNYCNAPVLYVQFALGSGSKPISIAPGSLGSTYRTSIQSGGWDVSQPTNDNTVSGVTRWVRFTATSAVREKMRPGTGAAQWEQFTFTVTGYTPLFPHYFQMHVGDTYDTKGPLDMSLCRCTNCDAGFSQRTIESCVVGYGVDNNGRITYSGPTTRAPSVFNENKVLYTYGIYNNYLALFYTDEFPMCLGVERVTRIDRSVGTYAVSPAQSQPTCIYGNAIQFGSTSFNGYEEDAGIDANDASNGCTSPNPANASMTCGRPMPPVVFITDITNNPGSRAGDWQFGGAPQLPHKICGLWQSSYKTVTAKKTDGTYTFTVVPSTKDLPNSNQNQQGGGGAIWNLGQGSDPPPLGFINPSAVGQVPYIEKYATEVAWDLDKLGLTSSHSYRFQFMVHDGDSTKVGGDVGQACLITNQACPAGFDGTNCDVCDRNPLPGDGSWSWYCFPTGTTPAYTLLKLPVEKLQQSPYKGSGGFIPSENFTDSQGYLVGCDCVRRIVPCPKGCCGNGECRDNTGTCVCSNTVGANLTDCCRPPPVPPPVPPPPVPPPPVPPPVPPPPVPPGAPPPPLCTEVTTPAFNGTNNCTGCISNAFNVQCAWCPQNVSVVENRESILENGTCVAYGNCDTPLYTCEIPPPPPSCENNLSSPDITCKTCLENDLGLQCAWCPSEKITNLSSEEALTVGSCVSYQTCPTLELYECVNPDEPPCFNNGSFCNGNGNCVDGKCVCVPDEDGTEFTGESCSEPVPPPSQSCQKLNATNCSTCLAVAQAYGLSCAWCPNTTVPQDQLTQGECIEDFVCGNQSFYACLPPASVVPPECPDNCTGNGLCVNVSFCKYIQTLPDGVYREGDKVYTCSEDTLNYSVAHNHSSVCICEDGHGGFNCILPAAPLNLALVGGIAAGILALIIVLGILGLALCGGGAYAASTAIGTEMTGAVEVNPIYEGNQCEADNPLFR